MEQREQLVKALAIAQKVAIENNMAFKDLRGYRLNIRAAARALWAGAITVDDFDMEMDMIIRRGFFQAWAEGAGEENVAMAELTTQERLELQRQIDNDASFIPNFATFIQQNAQVLGNKLAPVLQRADYWVMAYERVKNIAKIMAAKDAKYEWIRDARDSCKSCRRLEGQVRRASFWKEKNVYPKSWDKLDCKQSCRCRFVKTTKAASKGPLPMLP